MRGAKGEVDIILADVLEPDGIDHVVGIVMFGADGFVDDVPGMDAALVTAGNGLDMSAQQVGGVLRGGGGFEPIGIVLMPAKIVAASEELVRFGERHVGIGLGEVEAVLFGLSGAPLHLVFRDEDGALVDDERDEVGAVELGVGDGGAEEEFSASGEFAELGEVGGTGYGRKNRRGECSERELDEVAAMHGVLVSDGFERGS